MAPRLSLILLARCLLGILTVDAAVPAFCAGNAVGCIASYTEGQIFCDANYPASTKTVLTRARPMTTVFTTVYTGGPTAVKRAKATGWESCSSKLSKNNAFSKACRCVETSSTTTRTVFAGKTITTTSTVTLPATTQDPPASSSEVFNPPACTNGAVLVSEDGNFDSFRSHCSKKIVNPNFSESIVAGTESQQACVNTCDANPGCCGVNYNWSRQKCTYLFANSGNCLDSQNAPSDTYVDSSTFNSFDMFAPPQCNEGAIVTSGGKSYKSYCDETVGAQDISVDFRPDPMSQDDCLSGCAAASVCCGVWYRTTDSLCAYLTSMDTCSPVTQIGDNPDWHSFYLASGGV